MDKILNSRYTICEELGRGQSGVIYRCVSLESGESYACKSIEKSLLYEDNTFVKEYSIMQRVSGNPYILQTYETFEDDTHLHMIVELCNSSGDLFQHISSYVFTESEAAQVMIQLLQAVAYCHKRGVVHRDIKPENVLFDSKNRLKLADFGLAECFKPGATKITGKLGSLNYLAPEVIFKSEYDEKVDIWGCGVLLYVMLGRRYPFVGDSPQKIYKAILKEDLRFPIDQFDSVSVLAKDLITRMLCKEPSRRPSAEQVLRHPWMTMTAAIAMKSGEEKQVTRRSVPCKTCRVHSL